MDGSIRDTTAEFAALQDAQQQPWAHSFVTLLREIGARKTEMPAVGLAQRPSQESFRLGQQASLTFSPREIARVLPLQGRMLIKLFGLGMLGPNGVLPLHFTEIVRERSEAKMDETLANFLDLFHHRWLTHMYRAWAQAQSAAGLDRSDAETFTSYVARHGGDEPSEVQHSTLSPHARWATVAHRVRAARNPDGLVNSIARFFGVPVALHENHLAWMPIEADDCCKLGVPRLSGVVGQGAMLGEVVPDRQTRFRLTIGPLNLDAYLRLTPQGSGEKTDLPALIELVRAFIGFEYVWEIELLIKVQAVPPAQLGGDTRLGWSTWLGSGECKPAQAAIKGMILEPESYVVQKPIRTAASSSF